ncbi:oligoribonuclease [Oceanospirillum beijerinckii]|uniref:oligoribonuclease n=1 Tax=Oceanospirillum beijerinckii TaxID=64976 RepID=UPI000408BB31|nr:oligoribonuclease [Oceanospirillum beijerinckii]MAC46131.1 oligoribonuclease [Oceanospirillum sp.]
MAKADNMVWIDLEMTGLEPERDTIIEIATVVTDPELNIIAEGPVLAIYKPKAVMDEMGEWCTKQHGSSGLTKRVLESKVTMREAERQTLEFLKQHAEPGKSPMCGNSIHQDRRFLYKEMPELEKFFHYRHLDVSSVKELAKRWYPDVAKSMKKSGSHLAMDDIKDSINELRHYREHMLKPTA